MTSIQSAPVGPSDRFGFSWARAVWSRKPSFLRVGKAWISLDSLVRIEPFQWVTRDFRWKNFALPLGRGGGAGTGETAVEAMRMRRIIHEVSLARFLLFVNQSSSVRNRRPDKFAIQSKQMSSTIRTMPRRSARLTSHRCHSRRPQSVRSGIPRSVRRPVTWIPGQTSGLPGMTRMRSHQAPLRISQDIGVAGIKSVHIGVHIGAYR